jgi:uncharacterized protein
MPFRFPRLLPLLLVLLLGTVAVACKDDDDNPSAPTFDRSALLRQMRDNLIRPAFGELKLKTDALHAAAVAFTAAPDEARLNTLQTAWSAAYVAFQYTNAYNFGPAGEDGLRKGLAEEIGTFPANTSKIEATIAANSANFNDFNRDSRGLPTVEYLLFSRDGNRAQLVAAFAAEANRRAFLTAATDDIRRRVTEVESAWNGAYAEQFIGNAGTDAGSSTSQLYNEFVKSFEAAKNFKVGLPLGLRPGQTQAEPARVEAYYSGQSLPMLRHHLTAIEAIWRGQSGAAGTVDGPGFQEYLASVEGGQALVSATEQQLANLKTALAAVPTTTPLAVQITAAPAPVEALHTELQRQTRFFKSDLSSLIGIAITYSSGDGD